MPRWLIQLTGNPKRKVPFGPFFSEETKFEVRSFPFDAFAFPACEACNLGFSHLESTAKRVMVDLLAKRALTSSDFHVLLSWLDKVRVGLWLIVYIIQNNFSQIIPRYYISQRLNLFDRMVLIYRSNYRGSRLRFEGINGPAFQYSPTCFSLIVNDLIFLNVSTDFLLSKSLGLPYPLSYSHTDAAKFKIELHAGLERVTYPLMKMRYDRRCSEIYQPMIKAAIADWRHSFYDSPYVRSLCSDYSGGIGKILYCFGPTVTTYPELPSLAWLPDSTWEDSELLRVTRKQLFNFQIHLSEYGPMDRKIDLGDISKSKRKFVEAQITLAKRVNMMFLNDLH